MVSECTSQARVHTVEHRRQGKAPAVPCLSSTGKRPPPAILAQRGHPMIRPQHNSQLQQST
eukprot:11485592-Heterocapsa_arctica.AAC.1